MQFSILKTARRVAKRPPTGKPKLSRVTSGYGGLIIRRTRKNGGYIIYRRSVKKGRFSGQNWAPRPVVKRGQHKNVVFVVSSHADTNKKLDDFRKRNYFGRKNCNFGWKIFIFLRHTNITPIFGLRRTRLIGIISCRFMASFAQSGPKVLFSAPNQFFVDKICKMYHMALYGTTWNWIVSYCIA